MTHQILVAKQQAWCVAMMSVVADAYKLGAVLGGGAPIQLRDGAIPSPHVVFVPGQLSAIVRRDEISPSEFGPALVVDILTSAITEPERALMRKRYAAARILEVWQVDADRGSARFFQADPDWNYALVKPDKAGVYFSAAAEELFFPAIWFRDQPSLFDIMAWWGMIDDADEPHENGRRP